MKHMSNKCMEEISGTDQKKQGMWVYVILTER